MPAEKVSRVLKRELDVSPDEMFLSLNLTHPVGSASISQVTLPPFVGDFANVTRVGVHCSTAWANGTCATSAIKGSVH